jgi:hypothetical protein
MKASFNILTGAFALVGVAATISSLATTALAHGQGKEAMISPVKAMSIAAAKTGGKAAMAIYEFDDGHWIYGVTVVKNHKLLEVEMDPATGKIGETESVTPAGEAKEMQSELSTLAQ